MTLAEFKLAVGLATEARSRLNKANDEALACPGRPARPADKAATPVIDRVVAPFWPAQPKAPTALGYVGKSDRRSGLTRRTAAESVTPTPAKAA